MEMEGIIVKCGYCGGDITLSGDGKRGKCIFCGKENIFPKDIGRIANLYNAATFKRTTRQFDEAIEDYKEILKEDIGDADAHWGIALSRYGVEYVEDSATRKQVPTINRMRRTSILADPDYQAALKFSDEEKKAVLQKDAEEIDKIQKKFNEIAKKEPDYDVFICFKDKDDYGKRTLESVYAEKIYDLLRKEGYRVFFSRITLKLSEEFEPYIYSALNASKVMIIVGAQQDHMTAMWVKNEWARYIAMMREDTSKRAFVAYKSSMISPSEFPEELKPYQALDLDQLGWEMQVIKGLKNIMPGNRIVRDYNGAIMNSNQAAEAMNARANGQAFLRLEEYQKAADAFRQMTTKFPQDYWSWWGLILSDTHEFTKEPSRIGELQKWFKNVNITYHQDKNRTDDEYEMMEKEFKEFMWKQSGPEFTTLIEKFRKCERDFTLKAENAKASINSTHEKYENALSSLDNEEKSMKKILAEAERDLAVRKTVLNGKYVFSYVLTTLGVMLALPLVLFVILIILSLLFNGGSLRTLFNAEIISTIVFQLIIFFIGIGVINSSKKTRNERKIYIERAQKKFSEIKEPITESIASSKEAIVKCQAEEEEWRKKMAEYQNKAAAFHNCLDNSDDQMTIKQYIYSLNCELCGIGTANKMPERLKVLVDEARNN